MTGRSLLTTGTLLARLVLGLVFALSALGKITAGLGSFNTVVYNYHLLPYDLVKPFSYTLPWIEALVAIYLLVGIFLRGTAVVTIGSAGHVCRSPGH